MEPTWVLKIIMKVKLNTDGIEKISDPKIEDGILKVYTPENIRPNQSLEVIVELENIDQYMPKEVYVCVENSTIPIQVWKTITYKN